MSEISISNLDIAAFLVIRGFVIDRLEQNGPTIIFVFSDPDSMGKRVIAEFYRDPTVPIHSFTTALRLCRDRMWELKRQSQNQGNAHEQSRRTAAGR
jgi:hypothetical protein